MRHVQHVQPQFWEFGRGPVVDVPHSRIHHAFERWAARTPHAVAAEHQGATITYRELDRRAERLAEVLARRGVRPGDHVGLFVRRSIPMLIGLLATLKAGAAYVPQDIGIAPRSQLRHVMRTAHTRVVLTQHRYADRVPARGREAGTEPVRVVIDAPDGVPAPTGSTTGRPAPASGTGPDAPGGGPDDACYVLFTSGTTGTPNGVTVTHRNVRNILLTHPGDLGIEPGMRVAQLLNIAFDMAAWEILGSLSHGATLVIRGKDIAETAHGADVIIATPTVLSTIDPVHCARVTVVAVAGETCPRPLADLWARHCTFYNACGPTETTIVNTMHHHRPAAGPLTIGRPTPNNTVYVLDENRRPCAIGETGEMWAGGDCVSAGYLGNPGLTAERYAPDPFLGGGRMMFRTRDLGRWTPDGELEHLGRTDEQVKVRGFRVEPGAVSAVLETVPGCSRALTLQRDPDTLVSFVCPLDVDPEAAQRAVADALPYYCVPDTVRPLAALPETGRGKVDRAALLRLAAEGGGGT
ncbi:amino acid adenylation domain-containing protein [Streptomyces corynorhini]|uniref:Amino acid adenylation domain-containing protein n=1 Tax=Streptomyces corynorhini TaxID=2282652 RepID=A0A370B011_9ACTN|nr:amino acid adenylation domain-containing protein [Streptomyces corynorhini]RDG34921.1 amino acid adenylation domain-containing protein [Streptomyces corynorhini]